MVFANFTLPDADGRPVSLWDFRQRRPVVVFVCGADADLLQNLRDQHASYARVGAQLLAVVWDSEIAAESPFPVLLDADREVTKRLTRTVPAAFVLDRYGELRARLEAPWREGPDHDEILQELLFIESECPECGVPEWS